MREPDQSCGRVQGVESWWNSLEPEQRVEILRFIPLRSEEQITVFASRSWHELHGWMREDLKKLYDTPALADKFNLISYFRAQQQLGRGQTIHGVRYFVLCEADCQLFPELDQSYAFALDELPAPDGKVQYWLIATEASFDDDILLALSSVGLSSGTERPQ